MKLTHIKATNFLSFKDLSYEFEQHPVLIQGENLTEDSQESNGSGKSSLQAAIEFALFKTTIKEKETDLIFWGEEESTIELSISCPIRNQTLLIIRKIKMKGSSTLDIFIPELDSQRPQSIANVNDGNSFIINWIGISKEDLQQYFILSKERYKSFFSSSNKEKVEMIARFSNAKLINGVDKVVQKDVELLESELKVLETSHTSMMSKIQTLEEQIDYELNRDMKTEIEEEIKSLEMLISECLDRIDVTEKVIVEKKEAIALKKRSVPILRSRVKSIELEIKGMADSLVEANAELSRLNSFNREEDYAVLNEKLSDISSKQAGKRTENSIRLKSQIEIEEILADINKNLSGSVKCPKCSHEFLPGDPDVDLEVEKEEKISTEKLLAQVAKSVQDSYKELKELDKQSSEINSIQIEISREESKISVLKKDIKEGIAKIESDIKEMTSDVDEIEYTIKDTDRLSKKLESDVSRYEEEISEANAEIAKIKDQIEKVKLKDLDFNRIKELKKQIKSFNVDLSHQSLAVDKKKQIIFNTNQWVVNFKRFDMFLANNSLKIIQGYCNKFLQNVKSDIQIRWEGVKILGNGQLRENITPYIIRGSEVKGFWSFSGGERMRMEYSMILTLQRMINSTHHYGGLDILMCDEIGEGLDALGLQELMKSLSELNKTILITTHVVNRSIGDRVLLIRKERGVSQIVKN